MQAQLFYKGDVLQMRDKSQWEIVKVNFTERDGTYIYEYEEIQSGERQIETEYSLNRKAIVIQFAEPFPKEERPKCKIYILNDYRNKKIEKRSNNG